MADKKIRVVILNPEAEKPDEILEVKYIKDDLDVFYDIIGCQCIDIPTRKIGKNYYDIIVDDEGLLKADPKVSAVNDAGDVMLVGTLIVCSHDDDGCTAGLTEEQVAEVIDNIRMGINMRTGKAVVALHVEY